MTLTPAARALAASTLVAMEGLRLTAYRDGGGVPTIGVGSTYRLNGTRVQMGDVLTHAQAMDLLDNQIDAWALAIGKTVAAPLPDGWAAMSVSFVHQFGVNSLPGSVLADMLNAGLLDRAGRQLNGWVIARVNGVKQPVLGIMRRMEAQRQIAAGAPLEPTRTHVWGQGDAALRPLYQAACADALAYRHGVATWEAVPHTVPTHPSVAASARLVTERQTTADLNEASLTAAQQGA